MILVKWSRFPLLYMPILNAYFSTLVQIRWAQTFWLHLCHSSTYWRIWSKKGCHDLGPGLNHMCSGGMQPLMKPWCSSSKKSSDMTSVSNIISIRFENRCLPLAALDFWLGQLSWHRWEKFCRNCVYWKMTNSHTFQWENIKFWSWKSSLP